MTLFVWTLPIQNDQLPFGEGDAAWHFTVGDWIGTQDRTIWRLPNYIGYWYYNFNKILGTNALEYPPPNHVNYAFMSITGGDRVVPIYIYKAISSVFAAFLTYFLLRRYYGIPIAATAAVGASFGYREMMTYLFGQQPTLVALTFIPIVLYTYYRFLTSYFEGKPQNIYLLLTGLVLAAQYLLHGQGLVSLFMLGFFTLFMFIKHRKFYIPKKSIIWGIVTVIAVLALTLPFLQIYTGVGNATVEKTPITRLLSWNIDSSLQQGSYPDAYFSFDRAYPTINLPFGINMFVIFILAGVVTLALRRKNIDLLILSWLIGVYITLHLDALVGLAVGRTARMLTIEAPILYTLAAIGAFSLLSLLLSFTTLKKIQKAYARYLFAIVLIAVIFTTVGLQSINELEGSYQGVRISPEQAEAALWMKDNTAEDSIILSLGQVTYGKMRFMYALSQRFMEQEQSGFTARNITNTHILIDYSDAIRFGQQHLGAQLQQVEGSLPNGSMLVYDQNNIRLYELP